MKLLKLLLKGYLKLWESIFDTFFLETYADYNEDRYTTKKRLTKDPLAISLGFMALLVLSWSTFFLLYLLWLLLTSFPLFSVITVYLIYKVYNDSDKLYDYFKPKYLKFKDWLDS